jgi:hypothetical protein
MARALTAEELNERLQYGDLLLLRKASGTFSS